MCLLHIQTGIKVSPGLNQVWQRVTSSGNTTRIVKVSIKNESLEEDGVFETSGTFEQDFGLVYSNLADNQPAYVLVRLDSSRGNEWLFLCYVPDVAPIRQKMLYAATRASLTKELGDSHFKDSIYGTNKSEFTLDGYKKHRASLSAPKPLTDRERQLAEIAAAEKLMVENMKGTSLRKNHAPGVTFSITPDALAALKKLVIPKTKKPSGLVSGSGSPSAASIAAADVFKPVAGSVSSLTKSFNGLTSPASTPLPQSPVLTRENTSTSKEVEEDEWDNEEEKAAKAAKNDAESPVAEAEEEKVAEETETIEAAVVPEPEPEPVKVERTVNFVKLGVNPQTEKVELVQESKIDVKDFIKNIDDDNPRFTFFAYEHTHRGAEKDSIVFVYTCPSKSKIRDRMLYSACRGAVLREAASEAGLDVDRKLETTDVSELTEAYFLEELYPPSDYPSPAVGGGGNPVGGARGFSKPARPGARRVM